MKKAMTDTASQRMPSSSLIPGMCGLNEMLVYASLILIFLWIRCRGMSHDPENYANPSVFNPERFLGENPDPDPYSFAFGYGRRCVNRRYLWQTNSKEIRIRACPGMKIADISLFISISMTLATFDICKAKDERGRVFEPDCIYSPGLVRLVVYCSSTRSFGVSQSFLSQPP